MGNGDRGLRGQPHWPEPGAHVVRYTISVDPGLAGAIAALDAHGTLEALAHTPTLTLKVQRGMRQVYDVRGMVKILRPYAGLDSQVCIEESQPLPGQGK